MKIDEIIDFGPKQSNQSVDKQHKRVRTLPSAEYVGDGAFSKVWAMDSPKRYGQVTKIGTTGGIPGFGASKAKNIEEDGFLSYIHAVKDSNNPYFPRIDDLTIRKNEEGHLNYRINMQRLHKFYTESISDNYDLMWSLYQYMFNDEPPEGSDCAYKIGNNIDICAATGRFDIIKDPDLIEALSVIRSLKSKNRNLNIDLHTGNIMWRITGTRPQLVIVDPLA